MDDKTKLFIAYLSTYVNMMRQVPPFTEAWIGDYNYILAIQTELEAHIRTQPWFDEIPKLAKSSMLDEIVDGVHATLEEAMKESNVVGVIPFAVVEPEKGEN